MSVDTEDGKYDYVPVWLKNLSEGPIQTAHGSNRTDISATALRFKVGCVFMLWRRSLTKSQ